MAQRICPKVGKHKNRPIDVLCLEEKCENDRMLCFYCLFEAHVGHNVAYMDKELDGPIAYLAQNGQENQNRSRISQIQKSSGRVVSAYDKMNKNINKHLRVIENSTIPQFDSLKRLFKRNSADEIIKTITTGNQAVPNKKLESYAQALRSISRIRGLNFQEILLSTQKISGLCENKINQAAEKIEEILLKLRQSLIEKELVLEDQMPDGKISKKKQKKEQSEQPQESRTIYMRDLREDYIKPVDTTLVPLNHNLKSENQVITQTFKPQIQEQEKDQAAIQNEDVWSPSRSHKKRAEEKQTIPIDKKYNNKKINLNLQCPKHLYKLLRELEKGTVLELNINVHIFPTVLNKKMVNQISQIKNLQVLKVNWCHHLSETLFIEMVKNMPFLRELVLSQFNVFTPEVAKCLYTHNRNLKRLYLCMDYSNDFVKYEQNLEFFPDYVVYPPEESFTQQLAIKMPYLNTFELYDVQDISFWTKFFSSNRQRVKEVTIIQTSTEMIKKFDFNPLIEILSTCQNIEMIRLQCIQFDEKSLINLLKNNQNIHTLWISECSCVSNSTINTIALNLKPRQLYLGLLDNITGKYIGNITSLKNLIIKGCMEMKKSFMVNVFKNMKKLEHLSISYCKNWMNNDILNSVIQMRNIKGLCLKNNSISREGIQEIIKMQHLVTLILGEQNLKNIKIQENLRYYPLMRRLSLSCFDDSLLAEKGYTINDMQTCFAPLDLKPISQSFQRLTHLKLSGFKDLQISHLNKIEKINLINLKDCCSQQKQWLEDSCVKKTVCCITK